MELKSILPTIFKECVSSEELTIVSSFCSGFSSFFGSGFSSSFGSGITSFLTSTTSIGFSITGSGFSIFFSFSSFLGACSTKSIVVDLIIISGVFISSFLCSI
ncbi:MAG TPA: hypothetical protein DD434_13595 [Bacteroidales bacterium]|nr:hypothetical protein [Bacteroidales bacterium]